MLLKEPDNCYVKNDSTVVRAHQQTAYGKEEQSEDLARSRDGLSTNSPVQVLALDPQVNRLILKVQGWHTLEVGGLPRRGTIADSFLIVALKSLLLASDRARDIETWLKPPFTAFVCDMFTKEKREWPLVTYPWLPPFTNRTRRAGYRHYWLSHCNSFQRQLK